MMIISAIKKDFPDLCSYIYSTQYFILQVILVHA